MARIFDFCLELIKWPMAILAVVAMPALLEAFDYFHMANMRFFAFLGGAFVYLALKVVASARTNVSMQILAHEFTHIFFALLTFHKVVHIHLNMDESGGAMGFKGKGNWLIVVSPYFFPLCLFFLIVIISLFSEKMPEGYWINGILGYFFAYHVASMLVQIHGDQPDFKEAGFMFCLLFLPSANIFSCSLVLAFNNGGFLFMQRYLEIIYKLILKDLSFCFNYITSL